MKKTTVRNMLFLFYEKVVRKRVEKKYIKFIESLEFICGQ